MREPIVFVVGGTLLDILEVIAESLVPKGSSPWYSTCGPGCVFELQVLKAKEGIIFHLARVPMQPFNQYLLRPI